VDILFEIVALLIAVGAWVRPDFFKNGENIHLMNNSDFFKKP